MIFEFITGSGVSEADVDMSTLVVAGWTGRDAATVQHHIEELARLGVCRPSRVPLYYRVSAHLLTLSKIIEVVGGETSGEAEPVLFGVKDHLWVGVGSDHTDRKVESYSVAVSKQLCAKPVGRQLWRFADVALHWDQLILRAWAVIDGQRALYQEGSLALIRHPLDLIRGYTADDPTLPVGTVMFCGTLTAIGGVRPTNRFEVELEDPVLKRRIKHGYEIRVLPLVR